MNYVLNTDGGARGNPGPAAIGVAIKKDNEVIYEFSSFIGVSTNNVAEYKALESGVSKCIERGVKNVTCFVDSELVVKQLNGEYKIKNETLKPIWKSIKDLEKNFERIEFVHVKREKNKIADKLVNMCLDANA